MKDKIVAIVQAQPGWFVARFIPGGECEGIICPDYLALEPIIAWDIERKIESYDPAAKRLPGDTFRAVDVYPITLEGDPDLTSNLWVIKQPDGTFEDPGAHSWGKEQEEDVIAALRERYDHDEDVRRRRFDEPKSAM